MMNISVTATHVKTAFGNLVSIPFIEILRADADPTCLQHYIYPP
jgi:hypothetical protein